MRQTHEQKHTSEGSFLKIITEVKKFKQKLSSLLILDAEVEPDLIHERSCARHSFNLIKLSSFLKPATTNWFTDKKKRKLLQKVKKIVKYFVIEPRVIKKYLKKGWRSP